jgi:S-adenosylmethionine:tRNA ribosyltransferase-isomerase
MSDNISSNSSEHLAAQLRSASQSLDPATLAAYDYDLPAALIAHTGAEPRDSSRLLCVDRYGRGLRHQVFRDLAQELRAGDVLVTNETRVIPARLQAKRPSGGAVEVLLLREHAPSHWSAYLKPAKRLVVGETLHFAGLCASVTELLPDGGRMLRFERDIKPELDRLGALPLPPYIENNDPELLYGERYQTVYARERGSVAAPTAGLHFTPSLLALLQEIGVIFAPITLHVGAGTFKPVTDLANHHMHAEVYQVAATSAATVNHAKAEGRRVVAVGTTSLRTLESAWQDGQLQSGSGETTLFIRPGHSFASTDALITNFHLPKSTLLMLVAAFAGYDTMMNAYTVALAEHYRFYSLGDAMLIA